MKQLAKLATLLILLALTALVAIGVGVAVWLIWLSPWGPSSIQHDPPTQFASVSVPIEASSLAWSPDGRYIAAGTLGSSIGAPRAGDVFIVEIGKEAIATTLKITGSVEGLAFSPDGNWLAVTSRKTSPAEMAPAELTRVRSGPGPRLAKGTES